MSTHPAPAAPTCALRAAAMCQLPASANVWALATRESTMKAQQSVPRCTVRKKKSSAAQEGGGVGWRGGMRGGGWAGRQGGSCGSTESRAG